MTRGRFSWRRFAVVLVPSLLALVMLAVGMADGSVPASFAVSGRQMKVSADELSGQGFGLAPTNVRSLNGRPHPVMMLTMRSARIRGLCQSAGVDTPLGRYVVKLQARAPERPTLVDNLQISATNIDADVDFRGLAVNQDASALRSVSGAGGRPGDYGLGAQWFAIRDVKADAWLVTGGSFRMDGLRAAIGRGVPECF
ncbi:DUF6230 family protein [Actinomadura miaoliensis]|uniref:Cholesterol esterase n=1 Tax=Actinomadura miaoliensis TaxID=430685 RepID=A0ABP7WRB7_9ACTN